ncbi:MAG: sodium/proton-translocating pyrophosphatase [Phycisphaeraceae bacterium]|nr:sodium/proton-translocating pyrophosphatase [Phycisphaeraceae bacterium]
MRASDLAGACLIGFAIGESLGASALRIAGGIFTKIADIGSDLMKIVFKIKEDDARNPGVIADCVGDNAGDSVGPSADSFRNVRGDGRCADHVPDARDQRVDRGSGL